MVCTSDCGTLVTGSNPRVRPHSYAKVLCYRVSDKNSRECILGDSQPFGAMPRPVRSAHIFHYTTIFFNIQFSEKQNINKSNTLAKIVPGPVAK